MHKLEMIGGGGGALEKVLLTDFEYLDYLITPIGAVLPRPTLENCQNKVLTRRRSSFFNAFPAAISTNNTYIPNINQAITKLQQNTKIIINNMPLVKSLKQNRHINQSLQLASAGYRGVKQLLQLKLGKQKNPEQEALDKLLQEYDNNPNKFENESPPDDTMTNKQVQVETSSISHTSLRNKLREKALNNKAANPEIPPPISHPTDAVEITFTLTVPAPPLFVKRLPPPKKEPPHQVLLNAIPLLASKSNKNKHAIMANDSSFPKQSDKNNKIQSIPFQNKSKKMVQNSNHKNNIISKEEEEEEEEVENDELTDSIKHKKNSSSKSKKKSNRDKLNSEGNNRDNEDYNSESNGPASPSNSNSKKKKKFSSKKFPQDDSFPGSSSLSKHSTLKSDYKAAEITAKGEKEGEGGEEGPIKEIFDQSERLAFESTLLQQIADACCVPVRLLTIQEVVPLSNTNTELLKKWKKRQQLQEFEKDKKEAERRKLLEDEAALKIKINLAQNWLSKRKKKQDEEDDNNNNNNNNNNNSKDTPVANNTTNKQENNIDGIVEDNEVGPALPSQDLFALATGGAPVINNDDDDDNDINRTDNQTAHRNRKNPSKATESKPEVHSNNISIYDRSAGDAAEAADTVDNNELIEIDKGTKVGFEDSMMLTNNDTPPADNWLDSNIRNINEKDRLANRIVRIKRIIATEKIKKEKPVLQKLNLEDPAAEFALEKAIQFGAYSYKASEACYQYALKGEKYLSNKLPSSLITKRKEIGKEEKKEEEEEVDPSVNGGCKIVVTLIIDNSYRSREAGSGVLENITALDMAIFLQQQILHIDTDIDAGNISKYIVDISYRSCYTRRQFNSWEDYWSHFITPVFFGYSSKHRKRDRNAGIPKELEDAAVEVLPTGVRFDNPVKLMTPQAKEAFISLGGGSPMKTGMLRRGERPPLIDINASLGVEGGSNGSTKPKLYRPDMRVITLETLQKVKDVYKATKDIYDAEMRTGLVDGERLRVSQHEALQDMQEALRIFKNTARKFHKDQRIAEHGQHPQDPSKTTEWNSEMYDEWLAEAEEEDWAQLLESRRKANLAKKVRRKEVELRRRDDKQSAWMYGHLLAANTLIKDLEDALQSELDAEERRVHEERLVVKRGITHRQGNVGILGESTEERLRILSSQSTTSSSSSFNLDMMMGKADTAAAMALEVKKAKKDPDEAMMKILNREIMFKSLVASEERYTKALFEGACNFIVKSGRKFNRQETSLEGKTRTDSSTNDPVLVYEAELGLPCIKRNTFIEFLEAGRSRLAWERAKHKRLEKAAKGGEAGGKRVRVRELRGDPSYLQEEELAPMRNLRWLQVVWAKPEFEACLRGFPSSLRDIGYITGLELVQFARLVASVEPIFSRAKKAARKLKPNRNRANSRVLKSQDSDFHLLEVEDNSRKPDTSMDAARTLALEVEKRLATAASRAALREKQLATSHQHVFVEEPGGLTPFCALCLEQSEEFRWKKIDRAESKYSESIPARISVYLQSREPVFRKKIEADHLQRIEIDVRNKRLMNIIHHDSDATTVLVAINDIITKLESTHNQVQSIKKESARRSLPANSNTGDAKRPSLRSPTTLPKYLLMTGLSAIGPTGLSVLPPALKNDEELSETEEEKAEAEKAGKPLLKRRSTMLDNQSEIQIRVWNREYGDRGDFLGRVIISSEELLNPPKGMRAYPLIPDPNPALKRIGRRTKIVIRGNLFIRISVLRYDTAAGVSVNERSPVAWGLQICNATQIASLDPVYKSSPCCEVLWRGVTFMRDKEVLQTSLVELGETSVKSETIDPFWDKDDSAYFELPPVWTDCNIPNRGVRGKPLRGGWVAQNKVPLEDIKLLAIAEKNKQSSQLAYNRKGSALGQMRRVSTINKNSSSGTKSSPARGPQRQTSIDSLGMESLGAFSASLADPPGGRSSFTILQQSSSRNGESYVKLWKAAAATVRAAIAFQKQHLPTVQAELTDRMKALQLTLEAAELERQCMAREDRRMLVNNLTIRLDLLKMQMEKQQHIEQPPKIVERVCFLMASPLQAGGMKVLCEDPASKKKLDLMLLPMLYPDDEEELKRHVMPLLSRLHSSLMKVESFSVHQVRHFAMSGSPAIDQRIAAVVLESNRVGDSTYIPITIYMKRLRMNGEELQDEDLRNALIQMSGALSALHKVGFVHRNIHVDCLAVRADLPDDYGEQDDMSLSSTAGSVSPLVSLNSFSLNSRGARKSKLQVRLGDYWCFQNPRRIGCEYSMGRGDWGSPLTAPPEALGHGSMVCDRSDVWAMGICAYFWATGGHYPDAGLLHRLHNGGVDQLRARIPLNWGSWLSSLLIMCLQRQPSCRATADHIRDFLSKVNVKSKGRITS